MRILYFYQYFTVPAGSYSTRAYEFARRWAQAGDQVTIVSSVYDKSGLRPDRWVTRYEIEGIDVRVINVRLSNKHGIAVRLLTFFAYAGIACWYALVRPADVVIASSGPLTVGLPGLTARWLRRRPLVFEVRDLWPEGAVQLGIVRNPLVIWAARRFERLCYRSASRVVALSEGMADWIRSTYGTQRLEVVPNASDNELVAELEEPLAPPEWLAGKQAVLYTGTLGLIDDCGQILEAARVLQERGVDDVEFVLIGDGKERPLLEEKARALGLEHVHLLGPKPKPEVFQWLQAASAALFVTKNVPFLSTASPNKLFDAFAAGAPVIQTTQGWIKDLCAREGCGVNVPPDDPQALADAVLRVARDPDLQAELRQEGQRVAREQFDRSLLAAKYRSLLAAAAGRVESGELGVES